MKISEPFSAVRATSGKAHVDAIIASLRALPGPLRLVVFDSLRDYTAGSAGMRYEDIVDSAAACRRIMDEARADCVLMIAHPGHDSGPVLGSARWGQAFDTMFVIGGGMLDNREKAGGKQRDGAGLAAPLRFRLESEGASLVAVELAAPDSPDLNELRKAALEDAARARVPEAAAIIGKAGPRGMSRNALKLALGGKAETRRMTVDIAVSEGEIREVRTEIKTKSGSMRKLRRYFPWSAP